MKLPALSATASLTAAQSSIGLDADQNRMTQDALVPSATVSAEEIFLRYWKGGNPNRRGQVVGKKKKSGKLENVECYRQEGCEGYIAKTSRHNCCRGSYNGKSYRHPVDRTCNSCKGAH